MHLKRISLNNFKNIKEAEITFSPKLNCISGLNGSGKTNLLDAIYYLSMTKSYFFTSDSYSINYESDYCRVVGEFDKGNSTVDEISVAIKREGEKSIRRNSKRYTKFSDHIGVIPVVMVSPYDSCLINESGEERRRFINSILSQLDKEYLRRLQNYNHLLQLRNRLLKDSFVNDELLNTYTVKMSENASYIFDSRRVFIEELTPIVKRYYNTLSEGKEEISINYKTDLLDYTLEQLFEENKERDKILKYTSSGIQRDDIEFFMNGHLYKRSGSQGQQKSFLISLKLAQFEIMRDNYQKTPILLLDDVFDKLDIGRVHSLLNLVSSNNFGQIFITDSNKVRIEDIIKKIDGLSCSFEIESGQIL